jgi:prepilin-type processing-associated H-X9-DG protein
MKEIDITFGCDRLNVVGWRHRRLRVSGMTIVELLVVIATLSALMTMLLPAIQAARQTARNIQCTNNLHQIGVALLLFEDEHKALPAGWTSTSTNESSYGWAVSILPQLEEASLASQIECSRPIGGLNNAAKESTPEVYLCPADIGDATFPLYAEIGEHESHAQESTEILVTLPRSNYIGVFGTIDPDDLPNGMGDGVFINGHPCRLSEVTRGLSHVLLVGERTTRKLPSTWLGFNREGEDAAGRVVGHADLGPNRDDADECEFDSRHPGHVNFAWADGHVSGIQDEVDQQIYQQFAKRR